MNRLLQSLLATSLTMATLSAPAGAQDASTKSAPAAVKVMLLFYESKADIASRTNPQAQDYWNRWAAYGKAMTDAGIVRGGGVMTPGEAKTVRLMSGKARTQNKAYLDKKGELGGFFIIETASVEAAEDWAAKAPCAKDGAVELRVLPAMPGM